MAPAPARDVRIAPVIAMAFIIAAVFILLAPYVSRTGGFAWPWPVVVAFGSAIAILELLTINLVLNVRSYQRGDVQRSVPAFLIVGLLWWRIALDVLLTDTVVPPFLTVNFLFLSVCVVILAGVAVDSVVVASGRVWRGAVDPSAAQTRPEMSRAGRVTRIGVAGVLALFALGATRVVSDVSVVSDGWRRHRGQSAGLRAIREIAAAQSSYAEACAGGGYATNLADLTKARPGGQDFVWLNFADHEYGYVVTLRAGTDAVTVTRASATCNGAGADAVSSYFAEAYPVRTGMPSFATDGTGTIYSSSAGVHITPGMAGASVVQ